MVVRKLSLHGDEHWNEYRITNYHKYVHVLEFLSRILRFHGFCYMFRMMLMKTTCRQLALANGSVNVCVCVCEFFFCLSCNFIAEIHTYFDEVKPFQIEWRN